MSTNDNSIDNSLDSALNMSHDEIEKLLNGQMQVNEQVPEYEAVDLESLLSELEAMDDGDIQEISDLLDKAETNEAAAPEIVDLINSQEEIDDSPAYVAMDLFSGTEETIPKEGLIKRLLAKFKKKEEVTDEAEQPKEKKKEKKKKEKKKKEESPNFDNVDEEKHDWDNIDSFEETGDILNGSDAVIFELEKEEIAEREIKEKNKPKKKDKSKKKDIKNTSKGRDAEISEEDEDKGKAKKEKKKKEKKKKEKKKKEKSLVLYDYDEEPITKKKVSIIFFICLMLMFAIIALVINYAGHANRRLAEEAFDEGNYLQCYQLLYGQHLNESQEVMFHKSKIHLKMDLLWNRYEDYVSNKQYLESLDKLIQFVFEYPQMNKYATEWNCEEIVDITYREVLDTLYDEYRVAETEAISIANTEDDMEYTKILTSLVEKKNKGLLKYPNMLPEEEHKLEEEAD